MAIPFVIGVVGCSDNGADYPDGALADTLVAANGATDAMPINDRGSSDSSAAEAGLLDGTADDAVGDVESPDLPMVPDAVISPPDTSPDTTPDTTPDTIAPDSFVDTTAPDSNIDASPPDFGEIVSKGTAKLPFEYEFGATDQKVYAVVGGDKYPVELGAWGSHLGPQTGHNEGDQKVNYSVHIRPAAKLKELKNHPWNTGNNDGVCDPGDLCGVTAQDAMDSAPWYVARNDGWKVTSMRSRGAIHAASYVAGEKPLELQMFLSSNGVTLFLYHLAEWSPALETIAEQAVGATEWNKFKTGQISELSFFSVGAGSNAAAIPKGTVLARPETTFSFSHLVDGALHYYAHSQVEFSFLSTNGSIATGPVECAYNYIEASEIPQLQVAIEKNVTDPVPFGRYQAYGAGPPELSAVAQAKMCHSSSFDGTDFSTLESDGGYSWIDAPMGATRKRELFAVTKVHQDTAAYAARQSDFYSAQVSYLFVRATAGLGRNVETFTMHDGVQNRQMFDLWGEVTDLAPTDIQNVNGGFTVRIVKAKDGAQSTDLVGQFFSASYRRDADKIVVRWSSIAATAPAHPPEIPAGAIVCDGNPYYCYDHDYNSLWQ